MLKLILIQEDIFMARRRKMDPERKAFISSLLEHYQPKDAQDVQEMLKDIYSRIKIPKFAKQNGQVGMSILDNFAE